MIEKLYADFAWEQAAALLAIDSPTGYTSTAAAWVKEAFEKLGFTAFITTKGGVIADLGGRNENDGLLLAAHADTLGAMVHTIKGNGRLKLTSLGGMNPNNAETENVRVYTRDGKVIEGTCQLANASVHVNGDYNGTKRSWVCLPDEPHRWHKKLVPKPHRQHLQLRGFWLYDGLRRPPNGPLLRGLFLRMHLHRVLPYRHRYQR